VTSYTDWSRTLRRCRSGIRLDIDRRTTLDYCNTADYIHRCRTRIRRCLYRRGQRQTQPKSFTTAVIQR